jgi:hypothetical protein
MPCPKVEHPRRHQATSGHVINLPQVDGTFNKNNTHSNGEAGLFTDYQPLAIHPLSGPVKTPQKISLLAGKPAFSQNYFPFRLFTSPTPASIPPLFYS